ncbi:MAG: FAD-dependent oxidoreductase, partial [Candidatus Bathyarchaeia archaeon]
MREKVIESDVLVVGGGVAGCFAAVRARERGLNVTLVDMGYTGYTGATR